MRRGSSSKKRRAWHTPPSWQARAYRVLLRTTFKPLLRHGSVPLLRWMTTTLDNAYGRMNKARQHGATCRVTWASFGEHLEPINTTTDRTILYLPGGAFFTRSPHTHRALVQRLCLAAKARATIVHYRLAPKHPFPAALEDALDAYRHLIAAGTDPKRIVLAGDSAGGGLALSLALSLRDFGDALPAALVLMSPLTDLTFSGASRSSNRRRDPVLPASRKDGDARHYFGQNDPAHPLISPLFGDFRGLPPMLAQVGSDEILLDDTLRTAQRARQHGVRFRADVWRQMPHVWHAFPQIPESNEALGAIGRFIRREIPNRR